MEIRLHVLHGMHFIMYHDDHPIRKRHSSFSSAQKNTKTIAERLQKCPLTVKSVFEKMRLQMPPPLKKRGEKRSLLDLFWGEGCVCIGDRSFHWIHVEGRSNRRKNIPYKQKRIREERVEYMRLYCLLWTTQTPTAQLFFFCRLFHS